jgi:uncharacterized protein (DUF362 family)
MILSDDITSALRVAVARHANALNYPPLSAAPFHPAEKYPEYSGEVSETPNPVYKLVREALRQLGLDAARFGTSEWNPVGELVHPGAKIVVKPNWVLNRNEGGGGTDELITHASVLRVILDYVFLAKPARVVVGDAPLQICDFAAMQRLGFDRVADHFKSSGRELTVKDFRRTVMVREDLRADVSTDLNSMDDFVLVDLGRDSLLEAISGDAEKFRVTMYDPRKMGENHRSGVHRYLIARDILDADLVINVPKLKTHKKAGVTIALKNLIGINGNKDYLPHHRKGAADRGGDNYGKASLPKSLAESLLDFINRHLDKPRFYQRAAVLTYKLLWFDKIRGRSTDIEGGWSGNDTIWRTCLDLNKVLLYADVNGKIHDTPQRKTLHICDAIIAGEGDGPLRPVARPLGVITASLNAAAHDWIATQIMGLDPSLIQINRHAFDAQKFPLVNFKPAEIERRGAPFVASPAFVPAAGWRDALVGKVPETGKVGA